MQSKSNPTRDAFTFSLGGLRVISTVGHAPAIAGDRINKAIAERLAKQPEDPVPAGEPVSRASERFRLLRFRRAT